MHIPLLAYRGRVTAFFKLTAAGVEFRALRFCRRLTCRLWSFAVADGDRYLFFIITWAVWAPFAALRGWDLFLPLAGVMEILRCTVVFAFEYLTLLSFVLLELNARAAPLVAWLGESAAPFTSAVSKISTLVWNPLVDIDLTANTDCEDLLVFAADAIEFVEQDKALLFDALMDSFSLVAGGVSLVAAEIFFFAKLRRQVVSAQLARHFFI